jgi:hypothetical protein
MGNPTTWRDCSLRSATLERIELMVWKGANRIRAFSVQTSGHWALAGSRRLIGVVRHVPQ